MHPYKEFVGFMDFKWIKGNIPVIAAIVVGIVIIFFLTSLSLKEQLYTDSRGPAIPLGNKRVWAGNAIILYIFYLIVMRCVLICLSVTTRAIYTPTGK